MENFRIEFWIFSFSTVPTTTPKLSRCSGVLCAVGKNQYRSGHMVLERVLGLSKLSCIIGRGFESEGRGAIALCSIFCGVCKVGSEDNGVWGALAWKWLGTPDTVLCSRRMSLMRTVTDCAYSSMFVLRLFQVLQWKKNLCIKYSHCHRKIPKRTIWMMQARLPSLLTWVSFVLLLSIPPVRFVAGYCCVVTFLLPTGLDCN